MKRIRSPKDLEAHTSIFSDPLRLVMERIDQSPYLFQVITDGAGHLVGTITDGDVRRAILRGVSLDRAAKECMNPDPDFGRVARDWENGQKLSSLGSKHAFLPIVDDRRRVVEILTEELGDWRLSGIARALVMAGGYGRRLGERTRGTPKPLLPVGGRPILDHVIMALEDAGVRTVTLSIHYLGDQIRAFIADRENRAMIDFVEEMEPLGTAGALSLLGDPGRSPILVLNGDVLTHCDFAALHDFHTRHGLDGTIGVARYDVDVPYGVVRHDEEGLFAGIEEKPRISRFVAAGVYYLAPEFAALVPSDRPIDMPELLNSGREIGLRIGLFPIHEYWTDVGHPEDLEAADARHRAEEK